MLYLIVYDISDDHCRSRVSKYLGGIGQRMQESVFECRISVDEIEKVINDLAKIKDKEGNIRVYPICKECYSKAKGIGDIKKVIGAKGYEIF
jgi:CRISPR-associated protein Cas2